MILSRSRPDLAPFKHSRYFRLLTGGQELSSVGMMICYVALPYQAYRISHSSLIVGLLSIAELLPVLLAGLIGGTLAGALIANALLWQQLWLLFVLAGLLAGAFGVQRPSVDALVPLFIPHDDLPA